MRATLTIDRIVLSPYNVRTHAADAADTAGLEASIREHRRLIEPIIVHPHDGDYGAVAGGRRTRSIRNLVDRGDLPPDWPVPVVIYADLTPAQLLELSLSENILRRDLRDYEVFAAVAEMHRQGEHPADIARALGQQLSWADQALRLGNLARPVFLAFERGDINLEQARAFGAVADLELQAQAFAALGAGPPHARTPPAIRAWYRIEDREAEKLLRFVGADEYRDAGGWYERDLFDTGADGRGRVSDDALLRRLADAKRAALITDIRERTGRPDLRFVPQPPQGSYGGPEWALHVTPADNADPNETEAFIALPDGDIVAAIAIDDAGEPDITYWWASRRAMAGDKPNAPPRRERTDRLSAGSAIGKQYDDSRQQADAVIKEEAGLTAEGTQTLRSLRRAILRAAIVQQATDGGTLGRDYLVWAQARMLLSTAGRYGYPEGPQGVGMRALASPDPDAAAALPLIRATKADRAWGKALDSLRNQAFLTDPELPRAFHAFVAADPNIKNLAAAIVAGLALERSLDADGYRVPIHAAVAARAGLADPQGIRRWWTPTAAFIDLLPRAERAAIAEPFVERATFAGWGRLKSDELTQQVLRVVTADDAGAGAPVRKTRQLAAANWVHPLLAFRRDAGAAPVDHDQLEAAE